MRCKVSLINNNHSTSAATIFESYSLLSRSCHRFPQDVSRFVGGYLAKEWEVPQLLGVKVKVSQAAKMFAKKNLEYVLLFSLYIRNQQPSFELEANKHATPMNGNAFEVISPINPDKLP